MSHNVFVSLMHYQSALPPLTPLTVTYFKSPPPPPHSSETILGNDPHPLSHPANQLPPLPVEKSPSLSAWTGTVSLPSSIPPPLSLSLLLDFFYFQTCEDTHQSLMPSQIYSNFRVRHKMFSIQIQCNFKLNV